jgi:hypothetical protein
MFPRFFEAVRELRPKAFLIENVRGLLRQNFINYFEYITLQLAHPELQPKQDESWVDHLARLERPNCGVPPVTKYLVILNFSSLSGIRSLAKLLERYAQLDGTCCKVL